MYDNAVRDKKSILKRIEETFRETEKVLPDSPAAELLRELEQDMKAEYQSVVVIGEFKHGKSTFINAVLGRPIMPADVTPTTAAINVVFKGDEEAVEVVRKDGTVDRHESGLESLDRYTADSQSDKESIQYIRIFCNSKFLDGRTVLVDTPGVGDLSRQRADIAYRFIPRADVLVFVFDLTAPLSKSESEFLEQHVLNKATDRVLYLANFADRVDEEELEDALEQLERRLSRVTGQPARVFPISAREALKGKQQGNQALVKSSGISEVEKKLNELLETGIYANARILYQTRREKAILTRLLAEILTAKELNEQESAALNEELTRIRNFLGQEKEWESQILEYVHEQEEEIAYMAVKSFDYFASRLRDDLLQRIDYFSSGDIRHLAESQIPHQIKRQFSDWAEQYGEYLQKLFERLGKQIEQGLFEVFQTSTTLRVYQEHKIDLESNELAYSPNSTNASVKAGLWVGGAGAALLLMGGSILVPILGMAGMPFLSQKLAQRQLDKAKPELKAAVEDHLRELYDKARIQLRGHVHQSAVQIGQQVLQEFNRLLKGAESSVMRELKSKEHSFDRRKAELAGLLQLEQEINKINQQLFEEMIQDEPSAPL